MREIRRPSWRLEWIDESDPQMLGRLRQFFDYGSCLTVSPLSYSYFVSAVLVAAAGVGVTFEMSIRFFQTPSSRTAIDA
jgi:hypothetical protein